MRFMLEWTGPGPHYRPIGVWVEDGATVPRRLHLSGGEREPRSVMAAMAPADRTPRDFLEFHADSLPPQLGDRGPIYETDRYKSVADCADAVLSHIRDSWDNAERRWTKDLAVLT